MDFALIALLICAWIAVAAVAALIYGRVVARADHDNEMAALHREQAASDPAKQAATEVSTPRRS